MENLKRVSDDKIEAMQGKRIPSYTNRWSAIDGAILGKKEYYLMENESWGDETTYLVVTPDFKEIYETYDDIETCLADEGILPNGVYAFYGPSKVETTIDEYLKGVMMGEGYVTFEKIEMDIDQDPTLAIVTVDDIIDRAVSTNWRIKKLPSGFALVQKGHAGIEEDLKKEVPKGGLHKSMADLDEGIKDVATKVADKVRDLKDKAKDTIENKTYLFNKDSVSRQDVKASNTQDRKKKAQTKEQEAQDKKDQAIQDYRKASYQKGAYTAQLKKQAQKLDNQQQSGNHSKMDDIEKRQATLTKYQQAKKDQELAKKNQEQADRAKQKAINKAEKEQEKIDKAQTKTQKLSDKMDKQWLDTLKRYGIKESLNPDEMHKFFYTAREIGLDTVEDIDRFLKEQQLPGEDAYKTILRYRDELGADFKIEEDVDDEFTYYHIIQ